MQKLQLSTPFVVNPGLVRVLDGKEEGAFAWLAAQFLAERLPGMKSSADGTLGVLELGGASTQVTFQTDKILPASVAFSMQLGP